MIGPGDAEGTASWAGALHRLRIMAPLAVMRPGTLEDIATAEHEAAWAPDTDDVGQQTISQPQSETTGAR